LKNLGKQYIYLSYFLDDNTPLYGGEKGITMVPDRTIKNGDTANTKRVALHNHSGTHIDFPNHFFDDGKVAQDYDASFWVFNHVHVINKMAAADELIVLTDDELQPIPVETEFLIFKTGFSAFRNQDQYWTNNPGISPEVADTLRKQCPQIRAIGMDFISLTSYQNREIGRASHREFLGKSPILLIEDMDLRNLTKSPQQVIGLPLMLANADGAPISIIAQIES
jgi:arylformamidase